MKTKFIYTIVLLFIFVSCTSTTNMPDWKADKNSVYPDEVYLPFIDSGNTQEMAKTANIPNWKADKNSVYPDEVYLSFIGSGNTQEMAKTDALASMARYFKTSVDASLYSLQYSTQSNDGIVSESISTSQEIFVKSQLDMAGIEYSDIFYDTYQKTYSCVAFLNRSKAANQYLPAIRQILSETDIHYYVAEKNSKSDPLMANVYYRNANAKGIEFLQSLEMLYLINPQAEKQFENDKSRISGIPSRIAATRIASTLYLDVKNDWQQNISTALTEVFSSTQFHIVKTKAEAMYTVYINIEDNKSQDGRYYVLYPTLDLSIENNITRSSVYSYSLTQDRTSAFSENIAYRNAYGKLSNELKEKLINDFSEKTES